MSVKPPFTDLDVKTKTSGFYEGHSVEIALLSKGIMVALVLWALIWPANANGTLGSLNFQLLEVFNSFYIIIVGLFFFFLFVVALIPSTGKRVMGKPGEAPEFSNFSWFSMMFGAGLGVGLMVFATAEPLGLWGSNPVVLSGEVTANSEEALQSAYRFTFMHYGFPCLGDLCSDRPFTGLLRLYARYAVDHQDRFDAALREADERNSWACCGRLGRGCDHSGCIGDHRLRHLAVH